MCVITHARVLCSRKHVSRAMNGILRFGFVFRIIHLISHYTPCRRRNNNVGTCIIRVVYVYTRRDVARI